MDWQDDQVVSQAPAASPQQANQPAWAQDEVVAPATQTQQTQQTQQTAPPAAKSPSLFDRYKNSFLGKIGPLSVLEPAAALATNIAAVPVSGIAGLGATATNAAGITNTPAADVVEGVGGALTYQPTSPGGQAVNEVVSYPFRKLAEAGDAAGEPIALPTSGQPRFRGPMQADAMAKWEAAGRPQAPGDPVMATAVNTAVQAVPSLFLRGPKGTRVAAAAETPKPTLAPREIAAQAATDAGFKLTPTQVGNKVGGLAEGLTGQAKLERSLSLKNAPRVNELAATEIGLPEGTKTITKADLTRLKVKANQPYNEIAKTGTRRVSEDFRQEIASIGDKTGGASFAGDTPSSIRDMKEFYSSVKAFSAEDAVNKIRKLRRDGYANKSGKYDPEKAALGDAQLKVADALDNELERHAQAVGKPELVANYKAARVQLAKLATVESALRGSDVSALALARAQKNGAPLSGNLKTIADSASEFEKSFQEVRKIRDSGALGVADYLLGVGGAVSSPALAAAVLARPAVRAVLGSDAYQRRAIRPKQKAAPKPASDPRGAANALATANQADSRKRASQ